MLSGDGVPGGHQRRVRASKTAVLATASLAATVLSNPAAADGPHAAGNMQLMVAKADALLHAGRAADAIILYRRAQAVQPTNEAIKTRLADAESQRHGLVSICESTAGAASVDACQAALLHGAPDEFRLLKRKGILLQSMDRSDRALDAFIAADVIRQDDESVALAIVALTDRTGRKDALALAARRSALLTLARAEQAAREKAKHPPGSR